MGVLLLLLEVIFHEIFYDTRFCNDIILHTLYFVSLLAFLIFMHLSDGNQCMHHVFEPLVNG